MILQSFNKSEAQGLSARVAIEGKTASLEGSFAKPTKNFAFIGEYAGIGRLGERLSAVRLFNAAGREIVFKTLLPGEMLASEDFTSWHYQADLQKLKQPQAAAHVSWIDSESGILFLDDLLPQPDTRVLTGKVSILAPTGWQVATAEPEAGKMFDISNLEKAVFYLGIGLRRSTVSGTPLELAIAGDRQYSDGEAAEIASETYRYNKSIFGSDAIEHGIVGLFGFPTGTAAGNWEAETRGRSVTIISADMPFKSQALQRLHEQLRHELFHLWIPNGVNLSGRYDWFYEGFALYSALKGGVAVNRIRFEDFLDTLSRAYNIDNIQASKISLIEASANRWAGANTQVYARGMLVAFLCDLAMLEASGGKRNVSQLLQRIYSNHKPPARAVDGNTAVLAAMGERDELRDVIKRYILGSESIAWGPQLSAAGIESAGQNYVTTLKVVGKPDRGQKALLDKLGYNNWRKISANQ